VLRLLAGFILAPVAIGAIWLGSHAYLVFLLIMLLIAAHEWVVLTAPKPAPRRLWLTSVLALIAMFATLELALPQWDMLIILLSFPLLYVLARLRGCELPWLTASGTGYLGISLLSLWWLRGLEQGGALTFYLFFAVWAVDTGAYIAGRSIGGPKLAPKLSPNKTWAGLFGGMAAAALVGYAWAIFMGAQQPLLALMLGLPLAVVAQAGDIAESALKRRFGAKDSGRIIPGHGGVLDRIDGLLLAAPFFCLFHYLLGQKIVWW
jgi:phosphatidate cytidylyltransferase